MKILVCDDEPLARTRICRLIEKIGSHEVVAEAQNGFEAMEMTQRFMPDGLIIDIQMPGIDGLETAAHIARLEKPPAIIFSTAFDQYAIEAFNVNAIAYLLKPIKLEKLADALASSQKLNQAQLKALDSQQQASEGKFISAKSQHKGIELIPVDEIIYLKADQKYVSIKHESGETLVNDSLKTLEDQVGSNFVRIHRNAIISQNHIQRIETNSEGALVFLRGCEEPLRVSRRNIRILKELIDR